MCRKIQNIAPQVADILCVYQVETKTLQMKPICSLIEMRV